MTQPATVRVHDIVGGPLCVSTEDGQRLHDKILPLLEAGTPLVLSFERIDTLISAFLNAAIGQLYGELPRGSPPRTALRQRPGRGRSSHSQARSRQRQALFQTPEGVRSRMARGAGRRGRRRMKNTVHDLSDYAFRKDDVLLLDTNVWLYLNPAPSDNSPAASSLSRQYSEAFKAMLSARVLLIMDALVLGEYLNRYCRIEWNALHKKEYCQFKTFRKSSMFAEVGNRRRGSCALHAPPLRPVQSPLRCCRHRWCVGRFRNRVE